MEELVRAVERRKANVKEFNERSAAQYRIDFSVGYDVFDPNYGTTGERKGKSFVFTMI